MREFLYQALSSPAGIVLSTDEPAALIQRLNKERREAGDEALKVLRIGRSKTNPDTEVWIVKDAPQERQAPPAGDD